MSDASIGPDGRPGSGQRPAVAPYCCPLVVLVLLLPGLLLALMPMAQAASSPVATKTPVVRSTPKAKATAKRAAPAYQDNWNTLPIGGTPDDWLDPERDGFHYSWLYAGNWHIVASPNNPAIHFYEQSQQLPQPALSFRRYDGMAFGQNNGLLPPDYHMDVTFRPIASKYFYAPVGEAAVQVYYLDPTHYIEIDVRNTQLLIWEDDGGFPGQSDNWILYWTTALRTRPSQDRRVGADVDTVHHLLTVFVEGRAVKTLNLPFISNRPHWVALRAAGQWIDYENVSIQQLAPPATVPNIPVTAGQTFSAPQWWQSPKRLGILGACALVVLGECAWLIRKRRRATLSAMPREQAVAIPPPGSWQSLAGPPPPNPWQSAAGPPYPPGGGGTGLIP